MDSQKNSQEPNSNSLEAIKKEGATMKAIFIEKFGGTPFVKEVPIPKPGPNEVLIRVEAAPINPLDLAFMRGASQRKRTLPCQLGYEGAGIVVASGGGQLSDYFMGKRVCFFSPPGQPSTWAQYIVTRAQGCFPLGDSVSYEIGSSGIINPVTVLAFVDIVKQGNHKAVIQTAAASQVGKMLIKLLQKEGIKTINIVRKNDQKKTLEEIGADVVLNSEEENFEKELKEKAEALSATVCFECISGDITSKVIKAMPRDSVCYIYGHLASNVLTGVDFADLLVRNKVIRGFTFVRWLIEQGSRSIDVMEKIQDLLQGDLKSEIAKVVSLDQVKDAIKFYTQNMTAGKIIIKPNL